MIKVSDFKNVSKKDMARAIIKGQEANKVLMQEASRLRDELADLQELKKMIEEEEE